jgi:hypothetical protein
LKFLSALILALSLSTFTLAQAAPKDQRVVLVTLDGVRWQEVFRGADPVIATDKTLTPMAKEIKAQFLDPAEKAAALTPFLHQVVAKQGVLLGDRDHNSCVAVTNTMWFSYPGYNEILTGKVDPKINSNSHGPNANVTFLEWLNGRPGFAGKVAALGSWSVFNDILNPGRSKLPVNAGWAAMPARTPTEKVIAKLQSQTAQRWDTVRFDAFTHAYALEAIKRDKPRVLYISYGETDDFAHDALYDQTLIALRRSDDMLRELWDTLQADPAYRGKTTLIITTDHGRGAGANPKDWESHGFPWPGSNQTWLAAIGPDVAPGASPGPNCAGANQVAATALTALGVDWQTFDAKAGGPLGIFGAGK